MGFFDLNIPYQEPSASKALRLKLAVKSIELGYSGVAYNRTISGVMSEHHRCSTPLFPLSSVLKISPSLSSAAAFHRHILGVPASAPFRQYTRVTVVVESAAQAAAMNSGNPVLKSYDIVAVRPMNQHAFEQACTGSEVDLISIDFSEKLPFRLKQRMVKAAIERGVHFEISYSTLIMDVQLRRQMITSAKLLVDWTRGKNLIISSAAPSLTEIRGPYDVANLCSLLGLSMEHAKAALSKNCRSLIAKALGKRHYYKEAIRVEIIPSGQEFDSNENWPKEWMKWDPISSGDGDLFLEDMAKSFSAANKVATTVKPIDLVSVMDKLPSKGLQVQGLKPVTEANMHSIETNSSFADTEPTKLAKAFRDPSEDRNSFSLVDVVKSSATNKVAKTVKPVDFALIMDKLPSQMLQVQELKPVTETTVHSFETVLSFADTEPTKLVKTFLDTSEDQNSLHTSSSQHQVYSCEDSVKLISPTQTQGSLSNDVKTVSHTAEPVDKHNNSDGLGIYISPLGTETVCLQSQNCIRKCDTQVDRLDCRATINSSFIDIDIIGASDSEISSRPVNDVFPLFNTRTSSHSGIALGSQDDEIKQVPIELNVEVEEGLPLISSELNHMDNGRLKEITAAPDAITDASQVEISYDDEHKNDSNTLKEVSIVTDTKVIGDLSQTSCVSDGENSHLLEMKDAPVALPVRVCQDDDVGSSGRINVICEPSNEVAVEELMETEDHAQSSYPVTVLNGSSGKRKTKPRMRSQAFVFPFKRLLHRTPFKRKSHKPNKTQSKLL